MDIWESSLRFARLSPAVNYGRDSMRSVGVCDPGWAPGRQNAGWNREVSVNNVRQAAPGAAFTERGKSRNNRFVKVAPADGQGERQVTSGRK